MRHSLHGFAACVLAGSTIPALAQGSDPNTAMTEPDKVAWQLFIQVNTAAGGKATFETWGSDTDLFQPNPQWPSTPKPMVLRRPIVPTVGREVLQRSGHLLLPPGIASGATEETRRNQSAFDFIVKNNLYKVTGLQAAFGKAISFPVELDRGEGELGAGRGGAGLHAEPGHRGAGVAAVPRQHRQRRQPVCARLNARDLEARAELDLGDL